MRILFVLSLIALAVSAGASENNAKILLLENAQKLEIKEITFSRFLPHAFYDQALASIPGIYPDSVILAKRRVGTFGHNTSTLYSVVCYKDSKELDIVTIAGVITHESKAWSFDVKVIESSFVETLLLVVETIAKVPFYKSLQPAAESGG